MPKIKIIMSDKPHKHPKWEKFKAGMKKAGKWTVKNLLPVTVSLAAGGLGLSTAIGGLASELFKKISDANLKIPLSEEKFKEKLEELCQGEGKVIEYLQEKIEQANKEINPEDVNLIVEQVMTPVVSEMNTMLEIMREEKADLKEILAGWLEEQSQMIQNEFSLTHEQISAIQNEMLNGFQRICLQQSQILENINNIQSKMQFELVSIKQELSKQIQSVFGQSVQTAYDLNTMFNLAKKHYAHQNLASRFDQPYNPDLYVRPELFFESFTQFLNDFKDPMKKNVPIFLLLAHLGMGKTWNFAYITEYMLGEKDIAIPFFINLKDGLQQQLYGIFNTQNIGEIADGCQKIKKECQLPIILILDGLDELTASDLKDVLLILRQLFGKHSGALCVALSCRIIAWVQDQQILNERSFFEDQVWSNHRCPDWKLQFDIGTPISCLLGEFSDIELDDAIDRYGLKKEHFSAGLYEICHQPYILRLVSEFIGLYNEYPVPENPESMASLFFSNDREAEKRTIMYRMGIHGNILRLFSRIINAFPSAKTELYDEEFQKFANDQYFRPILYSGIILRKWHKMNSVYSINPVYVPLLSLSFPHLANTITTPPSTPIIQSESGKKVQYFLRMANKRKIEKNFDAELKSLKEAESIAVEAKDSNLTNLVKNRMDEFEKAKRIREEAERKTREEAEQKAREEAERKTREEAEQKAREEAERRDKDPELNKTVDYRGTSIIKREMDVLTELEKDVGQIPIISSIYVGTFGVMIENNHAIGLGLYKKGLKSLPETIGQLTALTYLSLRDNLLTELPETIGQLTALKELYLQANQLTELPESIGNLTKLNYLSVNDNQLKELPESIGKLTKLSKLHIWNNRLMKLPESIGQLTCLDSMQADGNQLTELPETVGMLTRIVRINLDSNQLTEIPESIGKLANIQYLNLAANELKAIPESIGKLATLLELDLGSNHLTEIPESIGKLDGLYNLGLYNNQLTEIPESIGKLTTLVDLNLSSNQLTKLPESMGKLTTLVDLDLSSNQLTEIPETLKNLTSLANAWIDKKMIKHPVVEAWKNNGTIVEFKD